MQIENMKHGDFAFPGCEWEDEPDGLAECIEDFEQEVYERQCEIREAFANFVSLLICDDAEKRIGDLDEVQRDILNRLYTEHDIHTYMPTLCIDDESGCGIRGGAYTDGGGI